MTPPQERLALSALFPEEMAEELDIAAYQGRQIFRWIHKKGVSDFTRMSDLPLKLRNHLAETASASELEPLTTAESPRSGTIKVLFRIAGGESVESVLLRHRTRLTLCVSTQAGCPIGCAFCATGRSGFARDLGAGEIVGQVLHLLHGEDPGEKTPNIVFMGMGEPLRNYDATVKSVRLLMHPEGLGVGARKITVSTAGDVPGIDRFAQENWQVRLSVSLHAANDALRDELVPLNRRYNLERLLGAVGRYIGETGRQMTFEWCLIRGVNDSTQDAAEVLERTRHLKAVFNLIPYNAVPDLPYEAPSAGACRQFRDALVRGGMKATLREARGQDIDAACGQLRRRTQETPGD